MTVYSNKSIIIGCILFLLFVQPVRAQEMEELFTSGNRLFQNERYADALAVYNEIIDMGYITGELYYNMGNTYYKLGQKGKAILYYERAKKFLPEDEDLQNNIDLVSIELADKITPLPEVFYVKHWNTFRGIMPITWWRNIFFATWWITAICLSLFFLSRQAIVRKFLKWNMIVFSAVIIVIFFVFISDVVMDKEGSDGVVMVEEVRVYASPSETGTEVFAIHEGARVRIKRKLGDWVEVRLEDGKVGWIPNAVIEII